jgi:hypothetical protein
LICSFIWVMSLPGFNRILTSCAHISISSPGLAVFRDG